ncbi:MAG: histidine phosphatase family protein [Betaproteobacteria bacterium]|jgi:broad specificity phosphatase PhoE|nr:MAG: histidine phosphatase family protein [Betaproteobacteria bacterium]
MAELFLIRHAQASFGTHNYDRLSDVGLRQAELLGEFLRECGARFDAAYSGELERQRKTAEIVLEQQPQAVQLEIDARFNEIETGSILEWLVPVLSDRHPQLAALAKKGERSSKDFQKALEIVFQHWVTTEDTHPEVQSWPDYSGNAHRALADVIEREGSGKSVAVFTSGGTIATLVAHVLGISGALVYKFYEPLINCSVTRLLYSGNKVSLSCFNDHQFIRLLGAQTGEGLLTYR